MTLLNLTFVQAGVNADALSRDEYLNAPGEWFLFDAMGGAQQIKGCVQVQPVDTHVTRLLAQ